MSLPVDRAHLDAFRVRRPRRPRAARCSSGATRVPRMTAFDDALASWQRHALRGSRGDRALRARRRARSRSCARNVIEDRFDALARARPVERARRPTSSGARRRPSPSASGCGASSCSRCTARAGRPTRCARVPAAPGASLADELGIEPGHGAPRPRGGDPRPGRHPAPAAVRAGTRRSSRSRPRSTSRVRRWSAVRPSSRISPRCGTRHGSGHGGLVSVVGARRHRQDPARRRAGDHGARQPARSSATPGATPPTAPRARCSTRRCARPAAR